MPRVLIVLFIRVIVTGVFVYCSNLLILLDLLSSERLNLLQVSENSTLSIQIYYIGVFMKIANAECVKSKPYRVLTPILPVTTKFEQKTGKKCLKTRCTAI